MIPRSIILLLGLLAASSRAVPAAGEPAGATAQQEAGQGDWRSDLRVLLDPAAGSAARKAALARVGSAIPRGQILELAPALADGEVAIRLGVVRLLRRPDLGAVARPERAEHLALLARDDPSNRVRRAALEALGMIGGPEAASRLGAIVEAATEPLLRQRAAKSLAGAVGGEETIVEIVQRALGRGTALRTDMAAVGALLPAYGRWLADEAGRGGELPAAPALPLVVGLRHPDPAVRSGAAEAFEEAIDRLSTSGVRGQARLLLDRLASLGIERDVALFQSARLSLSTEGDARAALASAEELVASRGVRLRPGARIDAFESQLWLFRGLYLCGASHLALGELEEAGRRLDQAAEALDRALAERRDLLSRSARARHVNLLQLRALAEVTRTLLAIARGADRAEVLELARSSHAIDLEAQAVYSELGRNVLTSWDGLLLLDLSAYRLLFGKTGFASTGASQGERGEDGSFGRARLIELQGLLGQALATVAPGELPGFTPLAPSVPAGERGRLIDPVEDPERLALLERIRDARLGGLDDAIEDAEESFARARDRALGLLPEEEFETLERLRRQRFFAARQRENEEPGSRAWIRDLRIPGSAALWHAQDLVDEGRGEEARVLAREIEADVERRGISDWWYTSGHDRIIRARMLAGSALTDEGRGEEAETVLLSAVERIGDLRREMLDRGVAREDLGGFDGLESSALVSLAVNANVRMGDPDRAAAYYERAYALRQDEFMRALLACYRARAGREEEARALVAAIRPGPGTWYNLACTHALLGDVERALDLLEIELRLGHATDESRDKQRVWAAEDPDLAALRDSPRFRRLVAVR